MPQLRNEFPNELLLSIFSYLPVNDLSSVCCVSRFFHQVGNDNLLWKNNVKKYFPHYLPLLVNEKDVDYKKIFYNSMKSDYKCTRQVDAWESIRQPFNKEEVKLFNAAKLDVLDLFAKSLEAYDTLEKLEQLLSLTDQTERTLFNWAGYFANQRILDCIFKNINGLFTVEGNIDHTKEINGFTYYQFAVMCNQIDIIKQLTNDELQVLNSRDNPISALAIDCCHIELTRYLCEERSLDLSQQSIDGRKPFHYAAAHGNSEILKYVLSKCEVTNADTVTLYTASISCNNAVSMQLLLKDNYDVNAHANIPRRLGNVIVRFSSEDSALQTALSRKSPVLAIMLLANPACNAHIALKKTIYHNLYTFSPEMNLALAQRLFESVKRYYLDDNNNYDTSKKDQFGNSIFHWLAFCNQVEILHSFSDTLYNEENSSHHTPAHLAAICGHLNIIKIYLSNGLDVNTSYNYSATLLHTATCNGHQELVRYLAAYPEINLNLCNDHDSTPLREACAEGHEDTVAILLEAGADVNLCNLHGVTPLIAAAEKGNANILKMLLAHSEINVNLKVINGSTALDYARRNGHEECVRLLKTHQNSSYCVVL